MIAKPWGGRIPRGQKSKAAGSRDVWRAWLEGGRMRMGREVWGWCMRSQVRFHPGKTGAGFAEGLLLSMLDKHL